LSRSASKAKKSKSSRKRSSWRTLLTLTTLLVLVLMGGAVAWLQMPMGFKPKADLSNAAQSGQALDLSIELGTSPKGVAHAIADAGADVSPQLLSLWFRLSGQDRAIKAGSYEISADMSPRTVLNMLARGEGKLAQYHAGGGLDIQAIQAGFGQSRHPQAKHSRHE
jgi:UPF0755 protein